MVVEIKEACKRGDGVLNRITLIAERLPIDAFTHLSRSRGIRECRPLHPTFIILSNLTMSQADKNAKQYWYPNMGNADIIDSLDGWGISVTHQQLVKPSPEFVLTVYSACLQQVVGLGEDSLQDPVQSALFSLDEPSAVRSLDRALQRSSDTIVGHVRSSNQH
jgi:Nuf2 family